MTRLVRSNYNVVGRRGFSCEGNLWRVDNLPGELTSAYAVIHVLKKNNYKDDEKLQSNVAETKQFFRNKVTKSSCHVITEKCGKEMCHKQIY
jgi:hypothetical protein